MANTYIVPVGDSARHDLHHIRSRTAPGIGRNDTNLDGHMGPCKKNPPETFVLVASSKGRLVEITCIHTATYAC
jgi:hypothetical protein